MDELIQALLETGYQFAAYGWSKAPDGDYGVYALDGANDLVAGGKHAEKVNRLSVDYFTRSIDTSVVFAPRGSDEYLTRMEGLYSYIDHHPAKTAIEAAFDHADIAWYLNSVQFEEDTGYVHFEWIVEVLG